MAASGPTPPLSTADIDVYKDDYVTGEVGTEYEYFCNEGYELSGAPGTTALGSYTCQWNEAWTNNDTVTDTCASEKIMNPCMISSPTAHVKKYKYRMFCTVQ